MRILRLKPRGRMLFKPKGKKQQVKSEPQGSNVTTEVHESLTPPTEGAGVKSNKAKLASIKIQNPEQKLRKFINLKL